MATTVTIVYNGPIVDTIRPGTSIPRYFDPANSYVDLPVMTEGFDNSVAQLGDKASYGKSIYATNVKGNGALWGLLPIFSGTQKYAMFEQAIFAAKAAEDAGTSNDGVTFDITSGGYEEQLYWEQQGKALEDQGFVVTVTTEDDGD